jgi:hypothetical protein
LQLLGLPLTAAAPLWRAKVVGTRLPRTKAVRPSLVSHACFVFSNHMYEHQIHLLERNTVRTRDNISFLQRRARVAPVRTDRGLGIAYLGQNLEPCWQRLCDIWRCAGISTRMQACLYGRHLSVPDSIFPGLLLHPLGCHPSCACVMFEVPRKLLIIHSNKRWAAT